LTIEKSSSKLCHSERRHLVGAPFFLLQSPLLEIVYAYKFGEHLLTGDDT
jgi:hypothetical protein